MVAVGSFDEFPTYYPGSEDFLVVPMSSLLARMGRLGVVSPWANELWMSVPGRDTAAVTTKVNSDLTLLNTQLHDRRAGAGRCAQRSAAKWVRGGARASGRSSRCSSSSSTSRCIFSPRRETGRRNTRSCAPTESRSRRCATHSSASRSRCSSAGSLPEPRSVLPSRWAVLPVFHLGNQPADLVPPSLFHIDALTLIAVVLGTGVLALVTGVVVAGRGARVHVMTAIRALT